RGPRLSSHRLLRPPRPTLFPYTTLFRSVAQFGVFERHPRRDDRRGCRLPVRPQFRTAPPHAVARMEDQGRVAGRIGVVDTTLIRSEEHTSELQSRSDLVCRLLLEKKKKS